MTLELVLFIGLQAAGKSSFYRTRFAGSHALVSKDCFPNNRNPARRPKPDDNHVNRLPIDSHRNETITDRRCRRPHDLPE